MLTNKLIFSNMSDLFAESQSAWLAEPNSYVDAITNSIFKRNYVIIMIIVFLFVLQTQAGEHERKWTDLLS